MRFFLFFCSFSPSWFVFGRSTPLQAGRTVPIQGTFNNEKHAPASSATANKNVSISSSVSEIETEHRRPIREDIVSDIGVPPPAVAFDEDLTPKTELTSCTESPDCKSSFLFLPGTPRQCRYPVAELCPVSCGLCHLIDTARACQTPSINNRGINPFFSAMGVGIPNHPAFRTSSIVPKVSKKKIRSSEKYAVNWALFFRSMLQEALKHPFGKGARFLSKRRPWAVEFPNFLSGEEVDEMVEIAEQIGYEGADMHAKDERDVTYADCGDSLWCQRHGLIQEVYRRVSTILNIPPTTAEVIEFLKYGEGQHFQLHADSSDFHRRPKIEQDIINSGVRVISVFFYLSTVEKGGETEFPYAKKPFAIKPKKGKVAIWLNVEEGDLWELAKYSEHRARMVVKGVKIAANFFFHPVAYRAPLIYAGAECKSAKDEDVEEDEEENIERNGEEDGEDDGEENGEEDVDEG